jgi:hypothetical protein
MQPLPNHQVQVGFIGYMKIESSEILFTGFGRGRGWVMNPTPAEAATEVRPPPGFGRGGYGRGLAPL